MRSKTTTAVKALSLLCALTMLFSFLPLCASASSIGDGSQTCSMTLGHGHHYLTTTAGTTLGAWSYTYTTNDGLTGPAYCINHGLHFTNRTLPIDGKYTSSTETAGVFANGYPQHELTTFLGLYLSDNPILSGLTEDEYAYATQLAVWATLGGLELIKVNAADKTQRIANVTFEIRKMDGGLVKTVTTGKDGCVYVNLDAGDYYAVEIETAKGFKLDNTKQYFTVKDGETTELTVENTPYSGIEIHKIDSVTGAGIYGAKFMLYDAEKHPVGEYVSNQDGFIYIDNLTRDGTYYIRELECEGYNVDTQEKTVTVKSGEIIQIEWKNTPITGQIMVTKYASEANSVTGQDAGSPLQGATYEIVNPRNLAVVAHITTDARGIAASDPLPLGRYQIREVSAPAYWQVSSDMFDVTLEYPGQIIRLAAYNKPAELGVALNKTGIKEVLAGSQMQYNFTVANTSNVELDSFFFHDKLPYDVTTATAITTGTYSQRMTYRILYKTNMSEYRVLASNLLTTNNYAYQLSGLPLMEGEAVTDIYFDFGKVPAGFQCVAKPTLTVQASGTAVNGYQIINRADAGGQYGGTWQTANASWITVLVNLTPKAPLPKTGY